MAFSAAEAILHAAGVRQPADIDLEAIAWRQGAIVKMCPLQGCQAQIRGLEGHAVIRVSDALNPTRKRFSIGHELGHWHLHRGKNFRCGKAQIGHPHQLSLHEREADIFAADLTLPNFLFTPIANQLTSSTDPTVYYDLAALFQASLDSTLIKFVDVGLRPMTLISRNEAERLWFRHSEPLRGSWFLRETSPQVSNCPTSRNEQRRCWTSLRPVGDWFERFPKGVSEVAELHFRRSSANVLTLLMPVL
jgi:Zn-dependent peptidase ImmA (M78 family)